MSDVVAGTATGPATDAVADVVAATEQAVDLEVASRALLALSVNALAAVEDRVSASQLRALLALGHRGPMPLTTLARSLRVGVSSASRLVDRLVQAGLVDRQVAPGNRRQVRLELTADGARVLSDLVARRRRDISAVLARMDPPARDELLRGMRAFAVLALGPADGSRPT